MSSTAKLTTEDLTTALNDDRHQGWGYAEADLIGSTSKRERLDRVVVAVANELGMNAEQLFEWTNSKYGRWLTDDVHGCNASPSTPTVRRYLNAEALFVLAEGR
jgi:hypothetical protein